MKIPSSFRVFALLFLLWVRGLALGQQPKTVTLFEGDSLNGWTASQGYWRCENGVITGEIPEGKQMTRPEVPRGLAAMREQVHDFELAGELRMSGAASGTICVRASRAGMYHFEFTSDPAGFGRLVEHHPGSFSTGKKAIAAESGTRVSVSPDGRVWSEPLPRLNGPPQFTPADWTRFRIRSTQWHVELWLNDRLVCAYDNHQQSMADCDGYLDFGVADKPGSMQLRNLRLTRLGESALFPPGTLLIDGPVGSAKSTAEAVAPTSTDDRHKRLSQSPVLWHLQPNPAKPTAVNNADAQHLVADMRLTPGFQAELIAAEPDVRQPVAFAIDDRGRLWVAEAYSYPNKQPEGQGKDRILIFEDKDGDGVFETRKVFIEGLNLVSGLEVGFGGVWVGAAPQLLFIPDRNHDDVPDGPPEVLLDGWGYQDTHETLNSFCWGPDGWLYGNQGVFTNSVIGRPGAPESERITLHSGVWRYHPVRHQFEVFARGGSNQWGLDYNEAGHFFMTHCRSFYGGGGTTYVIRNGQFWNQSNSNYAPYISNVGPDFAPDLKNYLPAAAQYDSGEGGAGKKGSDAIYGGHSHVGTMIYLGDNWPEIYRDHLFTHNLFGHQMNQQENVRQGSAYETVHAGYDLLCAPDPRYIAVDLQTGPDGAVYIIDWCDTQHCHSPVDEKWDRTNGRIYRVSWAKTYQPVKVNLSAKSDLELAQLQTHHNDWYSRQARQLLEERAANGKVTAEAIAFLRKLAAEAPEPAHVLRGLWSLHVIGALDAAILSHALQHPSDLVRSWAIQLGTDSPVAGTAPSTETLARLAKEDPSPTVRLALASAMPAVSPDACWAIGEALATHAEDKDDRFLPKMIWFGLARVVPADYARALALAEKTPLPSLADSIRWYSATTPSGRDLLVTSLANLPSETADRALRLTAFALKNEATAPMPRDWAKAQDRFSSSGTPAIHNAAIELAAVFGDEAVRTRMRKTLADKTSNTTERKTAFELLKRVNDKEAVPVFVSLLDEDAFRSAAIPLAARSTDEAAAVKLLACFNSLNEGDRSAALVALTSRAPFAKKLLDAVDAGTFDKKQISAANVRQLRTLHDAAIDTLLDKTWGKVNESSAEAKATIARLKKAFEEAPLWAFDAKAGQRTFQRVCATCHTINGEGAKLGPDLTGSWRNGLDYFLDNIVDPNAVVGEAYQLHVITKRDGSVVSGLLDKETDSAVTLRTLTETVSIPKSDIKQHEKLAQSLMPPGLLESLSQREAIELLKFLTNKS